MRIQFLPIVAPRARTLGAELAETLRVPFEDELEFDFNGKDYVHDGHPMAVSLAVAFDLLRSVDDRLSRKSDRFGLDAIAETLSRTGDGDAMRVLNDWHFSHVVDFIDLYGQYAGTSLHAELALLERVATAYGKDQSPEGMALGQQRFDLYFELKELRLGAGRKRGFNPREGIALLQIDRLNRQLDTPVNVREDSGYETSFTAESIEKLERQVFGRGGGRGR
jgi:hypothetical protein